jgi:hypothetical protein
MMEEVGRIESVRASFNLISIHHPVHPSLTNKSFVDYTKAAGICKGSNKKRS